MKISSDIKKIYRHFCMDEDKEGRVCYNQDYLYFSYSNAYFRQMNEFVFMNCVNPIPTKYKLNFLLPFRHGLSK